MSLMTIVAREDYLSVVIEGLDGQTQKTGESVKFLELIPETALIVLHGDADYVEMAADAALTLVQQGFSIKEIAESLQLAFHNDGLSSHVSGRLIEGIIGGFSVQKEAQFHIISNSKELQSYFPGNGECFYYANDLKAMLELEKLLKMHGIATIDQAQAAQQHLMDSLRFQQPHFASSYQKAN